MQSRLALAVLISWLLATGSAVRQLSAQEDLPGPPLPAGELVPTPTGEPDELVVELRIQGNTTIPTSQIAAQLMTRQGRPFNPEVIRRDVRHLYRQGWFVDVRPYFEKSGTGRIVIFEVKERPTIRYVQYLGNTKIKDKDLNKQTGLKVGETIDPYRIEDARLKIEEFYRGKGFNRVQVFVREGTQAGDKGVVFVINEGQVERVLAVKFVGNEFVSSRRLKTQVESKPGILWVIKGYVNLERIDADVQNLERDYRAFGFFQAKVSRILEYNDAGTWLTIKFVINEGPRYIVRNIRVMGNEVYGDEAILSNLQLQEGAFFDQANMNRDREWVKELYGSQGYVYANIRAEMRFLEEPGELDLVYNIEEGEQWRVGRIFVHIGGENPHTRKQVALARLSIRPGDILDTREIQSSERRLQHSGLFETNDPSRAPRITFQIPELHGNTMQASQPPGKRTASGQSGGGYRGQSPDDLNVPDDKREARTAQRPLMDLHYYFQDDQQFQEFQTPQRQPQTQSLPQQRAPVAPSRVEPPSASQGAHHWFTPIPHVAQLPPARVSTASPAAIAAARQRTVFRGQSQDRVPQRQPAFYGGRVVQPTGPDATWPNRAAASEAGSAPVVPLRGEGQSDTNASQQPYRNLFGPARPPDPVNSRFRSPRQDRVNSASLPASTRAISPASRPAVGTSSGTSPRSAPVFRGQGPAGSTAATPGGPPAATGPNQRPVYGQQVAQAQPAFDPVVPLSNGSGQYLPMLGPPQLPPGSIYEPIENPFDGRYADVVVNVDETQTGRFQVGVGVNSDAGVVGNIVIDERNFDWRRVPTSWEDVRGGNFFRGGGQRLRIELLPGSEVQRYLISYQDPYWGYTPLSFSISGSFYDRRYFEWDEQRLGGRVSLGYQWNERDMAISTTYRGENVNIHDPFIPTPPELAEAVGDNVLHGFGVRITNDTRDSAFLATSGHFVEFSLEQVVGTFDYARSIVDLRKYFLLHQRPDRSGRHVLSYTSRLGFTGSNTPIYENFFAGGYSTLRGFDFRGASPREGPVRVGGEFMWINSLEYLFPITADDMLRAVAFVDFGTVERKVEIENFRVSPGLGMRITVPAMGPAPIALDFAWPVVDAPGDDKQVFSFSVGLQR